MNNKQQANSPQKLNMLSHKIKTIKDHAFKMQQNNIYDAFAHTLRTLANQPIKGDITSGKLRWR